MFIITNFINFTNNRFIYGQGRGPSPDQVEDRLVPGRSPLYFYEIKSNSKEIEEKYTFI